MEGGSLGTGRTVELEGDGGEDEQENWRRRTVVGEDSAMRRMIDAGQLRRWCKAAVAATAQGRWRRWLKGGGSGGNNGILVARARSGGDRGGGGGWTPSPTFHEQPLEREETPFFS